MNPSCNAGRSQGFTLIEILAVIVIIGLVISVVSLSVDTGDRDSGATQEAQRLRQALDFVSELATLNGDIVGMFIEPKEVEGSPARQWCYHWQRFRNQQWEDLPKDTLEEHCMAETIQMDFEVEGKLLSYDPELETQPPVLVLSPSGEATPVEITIFETGSSIERTTEKKIITVDMMGNILGPDKEGDENDPRP